MWENNAVLPMEILKHTLFWQIKFSYLALHFLREESMLLPWVYKYYSKNQIFKLQFLAHSNHALLDPCLYWSIVKKKCVTLLCFWHHLFSLNGSVKYITPYYNAMVLFISPRTFLACLLLHSLRYGVIWYSNELYFYH